MPTPPLSSIQKGILQAQWEGNLEAFCTAFGNGNPLQYSCLKNPMGRGALAGYSPRGHKESDMTELLHFTSRGYS